MKVLTKMLLVHWHYFGHELIEFDRLNFLTGQNASGKSTIVDAMQLVLLGDTSGSYFNKAASGRSNRTLRGYLLGELGDDEESGFRYLRGGKRFSSYIALEFHDTERKRFFTAGCCFDVFSENDIARLFFLYDGEMHPEGFSHGGIPMDITALRAYLRDRFPNHHETNNAGRDFRTKLYGRLGGLRDRFSNLFKKAVSFDPNVDIQQFIVDFVCDSQQEVDVRPMQENIRSYKRLEQETEVLQEKIGQLGQMQDTFVRYSEAMESETLYSYLIDRAALEMKDGERRAAETDAQKLAGELDSLQAAIAAGERQLAELRDQRDTLQAELLSNGAAQAIEQIDRQIAEKAQTISALLAAYEKAKSLLQLRLRQWRVQTEALLEKIRAMAPDALQAALASRVRDVDSEARGFHGRLAAFAAIDDRMMAGVGSADLPGLSGDAERLRVRAIELGGRLREEQETLGKSKDTLLAEQRSLEGGIFPFPQDAIDLKEAVRSRLSSLAKQEVHVRIVAEAAEIKDERWRNVIEGYLNTQKYYVIVPREYFREAMQVLNAIKRQKAVYGTGLVDVERLAGIQPSADLGSLAEELVTEDADVRLFLDFVLGRVRKCDRIQDLRRHRTAVTDEGMLYHNFVVRAMNPQHWSKPAIGQGAIRRRLEAILREIQGLTEQIAACAALSLGLGAVRDMAVLSEGDVGQIQSSANNLAEVSTLQADMVSLRKNREAIDTATIDRLKARITTLDGQIDEQTQRNRMDIGNQGRLEERHRTLQDVTIPKLTEEQRDLQADLASRYDPAWAEALGGPRYDRERTSRGAAEQIAAAFPREQSRARNTKELAWDSLVDLRQSYNNRYKMGHDVKAPGNGVYDEAMAELRDNQLPDYLARINDAKAKAFEQFQEDFISRLQYNISSAKRQIDELNHAIRGARFGEDLYRFRVIPKPEYKRYYDMIVDEMITQGGYTLLSVQFNATYKDEINDLFAIITNEEGSGGAGSLDYERRIHEFTDFRTYLSFDLEVLGHDGEAQRLSKTMGKKSGGETQTPFYIAVLASFAQLYRSDREKAYTTSRLIVFDEAFSKMDGERIVKSIELLRKFDFQVILSAPPDKIGDIAPLVDRNICAIREGTNAYVVRFDPKDAGRYERA